MLVSFRSIDVRYVHGDGDAGTVAPRQKAFAAKLAADRQPGQRESRFSERHRKELAFDLALPSRFRLRRRVLQRAVDGGNACGRVPERVALCDGGVQDERVPALAGARHVVLAFLG